MPDDKARQMIDGLDVMSTILKEIVEDLVEHVAEGEPISGPTPPLDAVDELEAGRGPARRVTRS